VAQQRLITIKTELEDIFVITSGLDVSEDRPGRVQQIEGDKKGRVRVF
jgi:hypothetical protein